MPLAPVGDGGARRRPRSPRRSRCARAPGQSIAEALTAFLRERELLLVLDNFEHLLDARRSSRELLAAAPELTVLATSRTHLRLYGESEYAVPPLALEEEAVALFVERAQAARAGLRADDGNADAVAEICARLDGLPLAIELAAARIRTLAPAEILARLERRLELLTGGPRDVHARQRTLRDTIRWSYDLLPAPEQRLFARLGVFAGGWSARAADVVCAPGASDGLASLAQHNLIRVEDARFSMLETIRELAVRGAGRGRRGAGDPRPRTPAGASASPRRAARTWAAALAPTWLEHVSRERENLRAALAWGADERGDAETALRIAAALQPFWTAHALYAEGQRRSSRRCSRARASRPSGARGRSRSRAGSAASRATSTTTERACSESLALLPAGDEWYQAVCLNLLGTMARLSGRLDEARRRYERGAEPRHPARPLVPDGARLGERRHALRARGPPSERRSSNHERSVEIAQAGGDRWMTAMCMLNLARAARHVGDARARESHCSARRSGPSCASTTRGASPSASTASPAWPPIAVTSSARRGCTAPSRRSGSAPAWSSGRRSESEHDAGVRAASTALGEAAWADARSRARR